MPTRPVSSGHVRSVVLGAGVRSWELRGQPSRSTSPCSHIDTGQCGVMDTCESLGVGLCIIGRLGTYLGQENGRFVKGFIRQF